MKKKLMAYPMVLSMSIRYVDTNKRGISIYEQKTQNKNVNRCFNDPAFGFTNGISNHWTEIARVLWSSNACALSATSHFKYKMVQKFIELQI